MDREAWKATVHGVTESQTRLRDKAQHSTAQTTVNGNAKTLSSQRNFEKEKLSWRNQAPWLETILQSHGNQDSIVLAQKQTCRSWNKTESPKRNLCNYGHLIFWQRGKKYTKKTKPSHFIKWCWSKNSVVLGKLGYYVWKKKLEHFLNHIQKLTQNGVKT